MAALSPRDIPEFTAALACLEVEAAELAAGRQLSPGELTPLDYAITAMDRAMHDLSIGRTSVRSSLERSPN